jgi:hypothetical protein
VTFAQEIKTMKCPMNLLLASIVPASVVSLVILWLCLDLSTPLDGSSSVWISILPTLVTFLTVGGLVFLYFLEEQRSIDTPQAVVIPTKVEEPYLTPPITPRAITFDQEIERIRNPLSYPSPPLSDDDDEELPLSDDDDRKEATKKDELP